MIIGYDAKRFFHNFTGLGNYSRTLVHNLCTFYPQHTYRLFTPKLNDHADLKEILAHEQIEVVIPRGNKLLWRSRGMVKQFGNDMHLYHGLSHELPISIDRINIKSVVTIHDLIYHYFPKDFPWLDRRIYDYKFRTACNKANHIIAISQSTKQDLIDIFGIPAEKVTVIYQPVNPIFNHIPSHEHIQAIREKYKLPQNYSLYVGALTNRKNLLNVLRAHSSIPVADRLPLVILASGRKLLKEVNQFIRNHELSKQVYMLGHISFTDLPVFYHEALFTLYPSLYEGFGLPVVESLKMKTPVITSNRSSLPEAAGPGALLVNPEDPEDIADSIGEMTGNSSLRRNLAKDGFEYVQQFDARLLTQKIMKTYTQILDS